MPRSNDACPRMLSYKPPRIAMTLLIAATLLQLITPLPTLPASIIGGGGLSAVGFLIMLRAWWLFRVRKTAICPTALTTALITDDIYRLTRNPMYLGITFMLLGIALGTGGLPYYIAAAMFFLVTDFVFCPFEEAKLERTFGDEFTHYLAHVRRWL